MKRLSVLVVSLILAASVGPAAFAGTVSQAAECPGREQFVEAYALFMAGDSAAARTAFEQVLRLPDGNPDYAADAGLMMGWLDIVARNYEQARRVFEQVAAMTNSAARYRADAELGIGRCRFDTGDLAAASNAFQRAIDVSGKYSYPRAVNTRTTAALYLAGMARGNQWNKREMPRRQWTDIERAARETILSRQLAAQGLSADRCYLKGRVVYGTNGPSGLYPASGFPYKWDFDDSTLCGLSLTNQMIDLRVESGCLKVTTVTNAGFGWGRLNAWEKQQALRFGYGPGSGEKCPSLSGFIIRLRQSLDQSKWRVRLAIVTNRGRNQEVVDSAALIIKGTNWQEVFFRVPSRKPPYLGVQFVTDTRDNNLEIDWVKPCVSPGPACARKELELSSKVRWAKVSIAAAGWDDKPFHLFVNGREAAVSRPVLTESQIWNYDLDPAWFRKGRNVLALEAGKWFLADGALLCEDGTYVRFDTDESWRTGLPEPGADWTAPEYDGRAWGAVRIGDPIQDSLGQAIPLKEYWGRYWFNPSWKGRLMVGPEDGRAQPVFGSREAVALRVAVPAGTGAACEIGYQVFDEMGDGCRAADKKVKEGMIELKKKTSNIQHRTSNARRPDVSGIDEALDNIGELKFAAGELPPNRAYAVEFCLKVNGSEIERYRYELAVCGPVNQPVLANPTNYTDGMNLKLVWECDAAAEQPAGTFVSCDGNATYQESSVIETPLGRFRQPYAKENLGSLGGGPCNFISFKYQIEHPGRPHVAIADYPDDTVRCQEMRVTEGGFQNGNELGNDTVMLGLDNPLTHEIRQHHCLFFPGRPVGTVTFLSLGAQGPDWRPAMAARVGKIRIYEVLNDVPVRRMADAPGPRKWVGQLAEAGPRQIIQSCLSSPIAEHVRLSLLAGETPDFYRNWMIAAVNLVKRMKFAGENAYYCGQFMYAKVLYPSEFSDMAAFGCTGSLRDYGVLLARLFEENDLGFFSALQMIASERITLTGDDDAVADGVPTFAQVDRDGRQMKWVGHPLPNWLQPEVRACYDKVIDEWIALYGREPGWKGVVLHLYDIVGPSWASNQKGDPYYASYDDYTIALFEKETGLRIPVEKSDRKRFAKRYAWLMDKAQAQWTAWRCKKMTEIYEWTRDRLKAARPDLELIVYPYACYLLPAEDEKPEAAQPSIFEYGRRGGIDQERIKNDPGMVLAVNVWGRTDTDAWFGGQNREIGKGRQQAHCDNYLTPFANDGKNGVAVRYNWYEAQPNGPECWLWSMTAPESWPYPQDDYFADYWINSFIRTNPRLILNPLMDLVVWNGREVSLSRFAQAYRSLPATAYTRQTQNGCGRDVWISVGVYAGNTYGYIANPYWWETDATLELGQGIKGRELTAGAELKPGEWRGRLAPYTMRTFRFDGVHPQAIMACQAEVSETGKQATGRLLAHWKQELEANRPLLKQAGRADDFAKVIDRAENFLKAGSYGSAYEELTSYPARRIWRLLEQQAKSSYIENGWTISKLLSRENRALKTIDPVSAGDAALEWRPLAAVGNRVLAHGVYGDQDGIVYFANRIRVPVAGDWTICVGHDGGCRVFVDGQAVLCEPRRINPIREDRSKATIYLKAGDHDLLVAFDTDHGAGYGITLRFQAAEGKTFREIEFPGSEKFGK